MLALTVAGFSVKEIAVKLGVCTRTVYIDIANQAQNFELIESALEDSPIDAGDIHARLSQMFDADLADICLNPEAPIEQLRFKPIAQWPFVWRKGLAGKVKIIPVTLPDGQRTPGGDPTSYRVEIDRADILKILELSAKLRAVDAMVKNDAPELHVHLPAETARKVVSARRRLEKVIDVKPQDTGPNFVA